MTFVDRTVYRFHGRFVLRFHHPHHPTYDISNICSGGEARIQQDNTGSFRRRHAEELGAWHRHRRAIPLCVPLRIQVGWRQIRTLAHGFLVCTIHLLMYILY